MNRFFIDEVAGDINRIKNTEDVKHISKVLRLKKGDKIEIVDIDSKEYIMQIEDIEKENILLKKIKFIDVNRESTLKIILYQGIPKSSKMEYICQKLTEVGIFKIVPVQLYRCVKQDIKNDKIARFQKIIKEAAKQSKRLIIPQITKTLDFKEMLSDLSNNDKNIVFYEDEKTNTIKNFIKNNKDIKSLGIIIGPEGGIDKMELDILKEKNVDILSMGNRILRTETAGLIATSILIYEYDNL